MVKLVVVPDSEIVIVICIGTRRIISSQIENELCETESVCRTRIEKLGCLNTIFQDSQSISYLRNLRM
jgi:hypothetical protein